MSVNARGVTINVDIDHPIPGFLLNFTHTHIILGKQWIRRILDPETGVVVLANVALTQTEIDTMRWWCWQPAIEAQDIFIYPGANGFESDEDVAVYRGFHIEHAQAGGFIIDVLISSFGGDVAHVLRSFIKSPYVIPRMARRLRCQGIISDWYRDSGTFLQLTYTDSQKHVFAAVIPLVRYEYRLAHLVALESSDVQLRRLKAQLAVFLTLTSDWDFMYNHETCVVIRGWGWGKSYWGDLWKVFGMWKLISRDFEDLETLQDGPVSDENGAISLSSSAVTLFRDVSESLARALNGIADEFDVGLSAHGIMDESQRLSDIQMKEASRCLLLAYLNELVVTRLVTSAEGEPRLAHTIFSTSTSVELKA
ncbi:hypothetical protein IL306_002166 [Fusarium sp. DS 682]|nr:hypothetical protein IL306_002166 [Fusarium sp. DS 682]